MISLTRFNLCFTPSLRMFILTFFAMILFIRLGLWQLDRAHEKKQLLDASEQQMKQSPISWKTAAPLPKPYQLLRLTGCFLPTNFFLDNQHYRHEFGYDVISPLLLADGSVVLVDRGWVHGDLSRHQLPTITVPSEDLPIMGSVYYPSSKQFVLGQPFEKRGPDRFIIESLDTKMVQQILHKSVYPFIIRLNKSQTNGYIREWSIVSMPPARHYGYAVQWFAIALVIFILFIALNLKKKI